MKKIYLKKCEVCNSKKIKLFQSHGRIGSNFNYGKLKIFICLRCNHRFQNPRLPDEFFINYYLNNYRKKKHNNILIDKKYLKSQETRGARVYNYINHYFKGIRVKRRVLDHGSAMGHVMLKFKKEGWDCLGIDPNIETINSKFKIKNVQVDNYFGENLPKYKKKFDLIISLGSLEHAYNLMLTLLNIKKNLSDNGILFIRWRSEKPMGSPLEYFNFNHLRYFSKKSLRYILNKFDFDIIEETDESIEISDTYTYFVCKKNVKKKNSNNLKFYGESTEHFLEKYYCYLSKYFEICSQVMKLKNENKLKSYSQKKEFIKKNDIGLLSKENTSIDRFFEESYRFLKFLKKFSFNKF